MMDRESAKLYGDTVGSFATSARIADGLEGGMKAVNWSGEDHALSERHHSDTALPV